MNSTAKIAKGLLILSNYPNCETAAEHDIILSGPTDPNSVLPIDRLNLEELGWFVSSEYECWAHFT